MLRKILRKNPKMRKSSWNDLVICIPKTKPSQNVNRQLGLQLENTFCRSQQDQTYLKGNMAPTTTKNKTKTIN